MGNYKSILYKILFLIALLICSNYIYKYFFYEKDIQKHSPVINIVRKVVREKDEIIYVGESSNITSRDNDTDKRFISDFISDYFPSIKFGNVTKEATHAGIYYELLRNIPENAGVKTVIVTLNLRSFDANWIYSNLETPLQKSIVLLKNHPPLYSRFMLSFGGYDIKTEKEREKQFKERWKKDILKFPEPFKYNNVRNWNKGMAEQGFKNPDVSVNYDLTILACHYIKTYAFQIDPRTNPRIKDFDKIVQLANQRHWNLVFNLMAENVERADSLVGKELVFLMRQNRDLLVKRYAKNKVMVVDNLESVPDAEYIDRTWTTEHYAETGRKIIARNVAQCLKQLYPDAYTEVRYNQTKSSEFFNDCEGNIPWGNMESLTSEKAFSGEKSSKTGMNREYSITFQYPIKNLPDSLKHVSIDFKLLQSELNPNASLTFEIRDKDFAPHITGVPISNLSNTVQKWEDINYLFTLPPDFYNGEAIKIYLFNPTNSIIYIDDIKIKFEK
jgi:hypothetical protein